MTNKEAIERLKEGAPFSAIYNEDYEKAISLAIKALETLDLIRCKHCKYYVEDVVNEVIPGVPIIMEHTMCTKWGNGCKTDPDGYCFLAEKEGTE